jgi:hypothetical protein
MRVAVMQPYFLPYIGYWKLISAVDIFVVYDNIKYTKKGWINRNRFLLNGKEALFSISLKKDADFLDIKQRALAESFDRDDFINRFRAAYRKAPEFLTVMPVIEEIIRFPSNNLFEYIFHSIEKICGYLQLSTPLVVSSTIDSDHSLKGAQRVQAICKALGADTYINPIGGTELYSKEDFKGNGLSLYFLRPLAFEYEQSGNAFVPWLSILDVLMFNSKTVIKEKILNFNLFSVNKKELFEKDASTSIQNTMMPIM